jgi:hypothetical protein
MRPLGAGREANHVPFWGFFAVRWLWLTNVQV